MDRENKGILEKSSFRKIDMANRAPFWHCDYVFKKMSPIKSKTGFL